MKLYAEEGGSREVRSLRALVVSALARVEVTAAFWRKHRAKELSAEDAGLLTRAFEADFWGGDGQPRFQVIAVTEQILEEAVAAVAGHGLRAYDAVQLGSAVAARRLDPACETFVTFDRELGAAAAASGFTLFT